MSAVTVAGLPPFEVAAAVEGVRCWEADAPPVAWSGDRNVRVYVLRQGDEPDFPDGTDLELIRGVVRNLAGYVHAALAYLHAALLTDPGYFGLSDDDLAAYEALEPHELPLSGPELLFRAGDEWDMRFAEGSIPICDPYGIIVTFDRDRPVGVEDISGAEDVL
ncbi:hypothetical protein [Catenuloplanes indicus]|uniref:Uncharacterized protein n=1 Tax=Catenuloplanes indicus TaxID=137267 RepID=A0AAE3W5G6_9ACTN|nr:hypothetical protein [Catenuloplanes indicus]MDQ0370223.1 hypothetical protein [Catenuloplanes indicus]